ncbi:MAG TPA: 3'-5' exonuclease, partial [Xanthobacteraceae bacterium]|nr:3'-5' exonuclease [Xanthobacteraceae bacterium]
LDEFLNLALDYERHEAPSLQGFLAWLREAHAEIKRDMEIKRDEVRVMTVHGAKGLEAPIVILADTITPPAGPRPPRLLKLTGDALVWVRRQADDVAPVQAARRQAVRDAEDEYRRLLYVAMTRAADRLIVCGAEGVRGRPKGCWYDLVREPLAPELVEEQDGGETVFRYRKTGAVPAQTAPESAPQKPEPHDLPSWLLERAAPETPRAPPLAPSSAFDEEISRATAPGATAVDRRHALERGRIVHRLLQSLPDIPPPRRNEAAERYLTGPAAKDFSAGERSAMAQQAFGILDTPGFAELFAPGSRAEVPIVGLIGRQQGEPLPVAGQVDRLAIAGNAVLIADYKTDGAVPQRIEDVPLAYVGQLALYRAVICRLYPDKIVRAALIFTNGPVFWEVPATSMDEALRTELAKDRHAAVKVA